MNALYCDSVCRNSAGLMLPGLSGLGILSQLFSFFFCFIYLFFTIFLEEFRVA